MKNKFKNKFGNQNASGDRFKGFRNVEGSNKT